MSTRAMAKMYDGSGGDSGGDNGLDIFGLKAKRAIQKTQGITDIQKKAQIELDNLAQQHAIELEKLKDEFATKASKNTAIVENAKANNIPVYDANGEVTEAFKNYSMPGGVASQRVSALDTMAKKGNVDASRELATTQSPQGVKAGTASDLATMLTPALQASALSRNNVLPGVVQQSRDPLDITGAPITANGSALTTQRFAPHFDPASGRLINSLTEQTIAQPGQFRQPVGKIDMGNLSTGLNGMPRTLPDIPANNAATPPDDRMSLQTMPRSNGINPMYGGDGPNRLMQLLQMLKARQDPTGISNIPQIPGFP